jgi:hypothetical protein
MKKHERNSPDPFVLSLLQEREMMAPGSKEAVLF